MSHIIGNIINWIVVVIIIGIMLQIAQVGYYLMQYQSYQKEVSQVVQKRGGVTEKAVEQGKTISEQFYNGHYALAPLKDVYIEYESGTIKFYDKDQNLISDSKLAALKDARVLYKSASKDGMLKTDRDFSAYDSWDKVEKLYVKDGDSYKQLTTPDQIRKYLPWYYEARYAIGNNLIQLADFVSGKWKADEMSDNQAKEVKDAFGIGILNTRQISNLLNVKIPINSIRHDNGYEVGYKTGVGILPIFAFGKKYVQTNEGKTVSAVSQNLTDDLLPYRDWM